MGLPHARMTDRILGVRLRCTQLAALLLRSCRPIADLIRQYKIYHIALEVGAPAVVDRLYSVPLCPWH
jgi:hypothetical protein